jgi:hypothetical protein
MDSRLGCKSFNYLPPARATSDYPVNAAITENCEWTPNSAAVPDQLADDGNRGFSYEE